MTHHYVILAINPGSTSTKIAIFHNEKPYFQKNILHTDEELAKFKKVSDQFEYRKTAILDELKKNNIDIASISIIMGRGGLLKPIKSGVYEVNDAMKQDLIYSSLGDHASNLGGLIADDIACEIPTTKAYIVDPVVVDEMQKVARVSGHPTFERVSIFHALNQKAISRQYARSIGKKYEDLNLVVAHIGGGISIGAHSKGRVIDVNNALDGEGPFSPERSGTLPVGALSKLCFSGTVTYKEVQKMIVGEGGFMAHLGTRDGMEVENMIASGNKYAQLVHEAMGYQVAKMIGAMSVTLKGKVDGILITGGVAHSKTMMKYVKKMVEFIAPVKIYPGEDEMKALAMNAYLLITKQISPKVYK